MEWGFFLVGTLAGFFVGGWLKHIDLWRKFQSERAELESRYFSERRLFEQTHRNVDFVISHYTRDRVLSLLEAESGDDNLAWRAVELAAMLDSGMDEPNFPWVTAARDLMYSWVQYDNWSTPQSLTAGQFQEVERRAMTLAKMLANAAKLEKQNMLKFVAPKPDETLAQATIRLREKGDEIVAKALMSELLGDERNYDSDRLPLNRNSG